MFVIGAIAYLVSIVLMVASGFVMLFAVRTIRRCLKDNKLTVNTRNMVLHVCCFGLFNLTYIYQGIVTICFDPQDQIFT